MALSPTVLSQNIKNDLLVLFKEMESKADNDPLDSEDYAERFADLVANRVVEHIISFAQVSTTVTVASVSGVTTGTGVSGPGAGTGTGTIS